MQTDYNRSVSVWIPILGHRMINLKIPRSVGAALRLTSMLSRDRLGNKGMDRRRKNFKGADSEIRLPVLCVLATLAKGTKVDQIKSWSACNLLSFLDICLC